MGLGNSTKYPFYNQGETQLSQTMTMSYTVPDVVTDYVNFPFNFEVDGSPASKTLYLVGWEVDIQHYEHVHHFVGYFCPTEHASFDSWSNEQDPGRRYQKGCETQAIAWAPGSGRVAFPGDVTLPIGPGTTHASIIIEVRMGAGEYRRQHGEGIISPCDSLLFLQLSYSSQMWSQQMCRTCHKAGASRMIPDLVEMRIGSTVLCRCIMTTPTWFRGSLTQAPSS